MFQILYQEVLMNRKDPLLAGVERHAQEIAQTWQEVFRTICGHQLSTHTSATAPFAVSVSLSKRKATDIAEKEFKITFCHEFIEATSLHALLLQGKFCVYPFNTNYRVRVKGTGELVNFYRLTVGHLRQNYPQWASNFSWPP